MLKSKFVVSAIFATGLSGLASLPAVAKESGSYFGVRYVLSEFEDSDGVATGVSRSFDLPMLMFNIGRQINPIFAIEGRVGIGVGDDSSMGSVPIRGEVFDFERGFEIETYVGLFARAGLPTSWSIYPYFQLGYGQTEIEDVLSAVGRSITDDFGVSSGAFGFGVEFGGDKVAGNFEWMAYAGDLSGISFGAVFRF